MGEATAPGARGVRGWSTALGTSPSKITDLLMINFAHLAAAAAVVLLFVGPVPTRLVGAVLGAAALVLVAQLVRRDAVRRRRLLTAYATCRLVLLVAVAAALLARRPDSGGTVWWATGLGLLAVLSEPTVQALLSRADPVAVNLPGVRAVPPPPFPPDALCLLSLVVLALGALLAGLAAPGWVYLGVTGGAAAATAVALGHAAGAVRTSRRSAAEVPVALTAYAPEFVVYYGGTHGARYQLGMWLPYLERLGLPFVVITREVETVPVITELTRAPVLVPLATSSVGTLHRLVVGSMKAAFYVQGSPANLGFLRYRQLTHVWLNHGDSDKAANFSARHATYDKLFVAGPQGVDRYAAHGVHVPPDRFVVVGRPQLEKIVVRDVGLAPGTPRTILYAPTWRGGRPSTDYSSLPLGEQIVSALLARDVTVIFRPHPLSHTEPADAHVISRIQQQLDDDRRTTGRAHVWGRQAEQQWDVADCLNASDALVTDVSSVASDQLASGKPLAMVAMRSGGAKFRRDFPMARVSYVIEKDLSTLASALDHLCGEDPLAEQRQSYRRYCVGDHLGSSAPEGFLRAARAVVRPDGDHSG